MDGKPTDVPVVSLSILFIVFWVGRQRWQSKFVRAITFNSFYCIHKIVCEKCKADVEFLSILFIVFMRVLDWYVFVPPFRSLSILFIVFSPVVSVVLCKLCELHFQFFLLYSCEVQLL